MDWPIARPTQKRHLPLSLARKDLFLVSRTIHERARGLWTTGAGPSSALFLSSWAEFGRMWMGGVTVSILEIQASFSENYTHTCCQKRREPISVAQAQRHGETKPPRILKSSHVSRDRNVRKQIHAAQRFHRYFPPARMDVCHSPRHVLCARSSPAKCQIFFSTAFNGS